MEKSLLCLPRPAPGSHKGQNGVLLIIGGSRTYHGAPILAALAAQRFCDLVYFSSTGANNGIVGKMKAATPNVICVPESRRREFIGKADCILIGNGMDLDAKTRRLAASVLKTKKKCVLDAAALRVLDTKLLHPRAILTPHALEFKSAFGVAATEKSAAAMSKKYGCTILLKGKQDIVASGGKSVRIPGGNAGMTKGGTGDALAGLAAALYSHPSCPSPMRAAFTASFLNKRAGELLYRIFGPNFSSEDLADELAYVAAAAKGL